MNPKTCKMKSMLSGFELPHKIHLYYIIFQKNERIDIQTTFPPVYGNIPKVIVPWGKHVPWCRIFDTFFLKDDISLTQTWFAGKSTI